MTHTSDGWATRRARQGAILLDQRDPGWARRINVAELDQQRYGFCIAGQLGEQHTDLPDHGFAYSWYVSTNLGLSFHGEMANGFVLGYDHQVNDDLAWELLTLAWVSEIQQRV